MQVFIKFMCIASLAVLTAGCDFQKAGEQQVERLDDRAKDFHLTSSETEVAKAFIEGFKNETGQPFVHSKHLSHAICYAGHVEMPDKYWKAHMLYLEHYIDADKDYYGWFEKNGINGADAEAMGNIYLEAFNDCKGLQKRMKILKKIKNDRAPE